ncbi:MAG: ABC transporter ATP-binding protein [Elusimicrobia bacterium]|nr:ABC transporter ATP-binding protein [Candidatus Liberimonas magnetica]
MNIITENLHKTFSLEHGVEVSALRGIDLNIDSGQTVAIVGPSGAGKSTLLHILGLMDRPSLGRVVLDGQDYSMLSDKERSCARKNKIGFLFQLHYLLPEFTVLENITIPVWENQVRMKDEITGLIDKLGLADRAEHLPSELSGGEQQRVALARALINSPSILLADEPTGNLDRATGEKVEKIIFEECKNRGITLVLVTHNPELAAKADRIIKMSDGVLVKN